MPERLAWLAWRYDAMLAVIASGQVDPGRLIGRLVTLDDAALRLTRMDADREPGVVSRTAFREHSRIMPESIELAECHGG